MRKLITLITFIIVTLLIGRNLTFLPTFHLSKTLGRGQKDTTELKKQIQDYIAKRPGSTSMYFLDLDTDVGVTINENAIYTAGSVTKTQIVAALYFLANKHEVSLDDQITIQKEDIQDYGTGSIQYEDPGGTYSLKTLARLSLEQSDNTAAHVLVNKIGMKKIQSIVNGLGLTQTDMESNKTSLADVALLFKKIYQGKVASEVLTKELLDFMKDTDFEDRLPAFLPKDVQVYHKTADVVGGIHDAGIAKFESAAYFIGVMTSDQTDEGEAKKTIAEISKMVYEFEHGK